MDLSFSPAAVALGRRIAEFIAAEVIPLESPAGEPPAEAVRAAQAKARSAGLWAPHLPRDVGGQGIEMPDLCPIFEAAGRSLLGPLCLGCAAPDEGNAHLLLLSASAAQREKYLRPLAAGEVRSAFAMTEPAPGAGSDPAMMRTRASRDGDGWVIEGHKWFATGAAGAAFTIVAAVTEEASAASPRNRISLFLVDAGTPGFTVLREIPVPGSATPGGHCEIELRGCRVGAGQVLGTVHGGYALIQARLGPARLTHCMRWLGVAARALEIAARRARERRAFGKELGEHQAVAWMLADSATDIQASRLLVHEAAWKLSRGDRARVETSMCKVFVAEAVNRVIDRAIQVCGALGVSADLPLAHFYQEARAFRIYDGPSEVHRMVIARKTLSALDAGGTDP
jgi:acyl-CoA dehydrogenase